MHVKNVVRNLSQLIYRGGKNYVNILGVQNIQKRDQAKVGGKTWKTRLR